MLTPLCCWRELFGVITCGAWRWFAVNDALRYRLFLSARIVAVAIVHVRAACAGFVGLRDMENCSHARRLPCFDFALAVFFDHLIHRYVSANFHTMLALANLPPECFPCMKRKHVDARLDLILWNSLFSETLKNRRVVRHAGVISRVRKRLLLNFMMRHLIYSGYPAGLRYADYTKRL